jgi:hypothetical protein
VGPTKKSTTNCQFSHLWSDLKSFLSNHIARVETLTIWEQNPSIPETAVIPSFFLLLVHPIWIPASQLLKGKISVPLAISIAFLSSLFLASSLFNSISIFKTSPHAHAW